MSCRFGYTRWCAIRADATTHRDALTSKAVDFRQNWMSRTNLIPTLLPSPSIHDHAPFLGAFYLSACHHTSVRFFCFLLPHLAGPRFGGVASLNAWPQSTALPVYLCICTSFLAMRCLPFVPTLTLRCVWERAKGGPFIADTRFKVRSETTPRFEMCASPSHAVNRFASFCLTSS